MNNGVRLGIAVVGLAVLCGTGFAGEPQTGALLGADDFLPSPDRPVGWLGDFTGKYRGAHDFPLEWDSRTGKNILWKSELPEWGHSSPVMVGKRIFLTCEPDTTVCLNAETGAIVWKKSADGKRTGSSGTYHYSTGWSMGSVCSDGKSVFANHYNGVVVSYDLDGNVRWRKDVPPLGWCGANPILIDGKFIVIQAVTKTEGKYPLHGPYDVVAYSSENGDVVWHTNNVLRMNGWHYNGLVPVRVSGTPYLVNWCGQFFSASDGKYLAQLTKGEGWGSLWVPAVEGDTVVFAYQVHDPMNWRGGLQDLAKVDMQSPAGMDAALQRQKQKDSWLLLPVKVAEDGKGGLRFEVRPRPIFIRHNGSYNEVMLDRGILYFVWDGRTVTAVDIAKCTGVGPGGLDGWQFKEDSESKGFFFSHPVVAGDNITVGDWFGATRVFSCSPDFRLICTNKTTATGNRKSVGVIGGPMASLQSSEFYHGNRIYFRHWDVMYCIGDPKAAENAAAFAAAKEHAQGGRIGDAQVAYHKLWNSDALHVRYRAVREMGSVLGANALDELCQGFRSVDPNLRALAVTVAARLPGEEVARRLAGGLADADSAYRCQVLEALGQRGDRSASPQLATALDDKVPEVRLAAIGAAGRIGGEVAVRDLVARLEKLGDAERQQASTALVAMPEPGTETTMAELVPRAAPVPRGVLLRTLGRRGAEAQTALVLADTAHEDRSVRLAALAALSMIGRTGELDPIVLRMKQAKGDDERKAIEGALLGIFSRTRDTDAYVAAVQRGMAVVEGPGFASLIRVLGPVGGTVSLAEVRKALANKDAAIHSAAIEAIASWPDTAAEPDLMAVARTERNATNQAEVVRGLLRMIDLSPRRPADGVFAIYVQAVKTGQALGSVVVHLAGQKDVRAIEIAVGLLDQKELEDAIVSTITTVAPFAAETEPARTISALNKAAEGIRDQKRRGSVNEVIRELVGKYGSKAVEIPMGDGLSL